MALDSNSEQIREAYACFGLAIYQAQCLERQISMVLTGPGLLDPRMVSKFRYDDLLDESFDCTLGQLIVRLRKRVILDPELDKKLDRAVEIRNWLAHHYFWERCVEFTIPHGRARMVQELKGFADLFRELDVIFSAINETWLSEHGVTSAQTDEALKELLSGSETPESSRRRRLGKKERLIQVYSYKYGDSETNERARLLVFELADHTFWTLCDRGLTYGPQVVDINYLTPIEGLAKVLPADIIPKPKGAANWEYAIQLSTGFIIEISPDKAAEPFRFRWRLRKKAQRG